MKLTKISVWTEKENTMEMPFTELQYRDWLDSEQTGMQMFPHLTEDQYHFLLTGITPEENALILADVRDEIETDNMVEECESSYA